MVYKTMKKRTKKGKSYTVSVSSLWNKRWSFSAFIILTRQDVRQDNTNNIKVTLTL